MKHNETTLIIFFRSTIVWVTMALLSVIYCFIGMSILGLPVKKRYAVMRTWASAFIILTKKVCKVNYIIRGSVDLIKAPMIIVSNHQSMWETAGLTHILPSHVWVIKKELLKVPFFGWGLATLNPIAINRSRRGQVTAQIYSQAKKVVKQGLCVLFYPEGTRSNAGKINNFKLGAFRLAKSLNLPIVPVTHNAGYVLPKGGYFIFPGTIEIIVAAPIYNIEDESEECLKDRVEVIITNNLNTIKHNG